MVDFDDFRALATKWFQERSRRFIFEHLRAGLHGLRAGLQALGAGLRGLRPVGPRALMEGCAWPKPRSPTQKLRSPDPKPRSQDPNLEAQPSKPEAQTQISQMGPKVTLWRTCGCGARFWQGSAAKVFGLRGSGAAPRGFGREGRRRCPAEGGRGEVNLPPIPALTRPTEGRRIFEL